MRLSRTFVLLGVVLLPCCCVSAATFYVAPGGDDRWSGTLQKPNAEKADGPLATLTGARDAIRRLKARCGLREPVTVFLAAGTYPLAEPLVLGSRDSGTSDCPITYAALPGARPSISGGRAITGWKPNGAGLWTADVPAAKGRQWPFRQLWVNGRRAILARSPNEGFYRIVGASATTIDPATGKQRDSSKSAFRFKPGDIPRSRSLRGQAPQRFERLPCDPKCKALEWLGFVSTATGRAVFYLDNLKLDAKR